MNDNSVHVTYREAGSRTLPTTRGKVLFGVRYKRLADLEAHAWSSIGETTWRLNLGS